jgi:hypothetical protein
MNVRGVLVCTVLLVVATGWVPPIFGGGRAEEQADRFGDLSGLLREVVRNGQVDYVKLGQRVEVLEAVLDRLAEIDPDALTANDQKAFYVNLYNSTVLREVLRRNQDGFSVAEDEFAFFKTPLVRMSGRTLTLDELEKGVALIAHPDPRLHAAFVCAAASCPELLPRAYEGRDLDAVLDISCRRWLADPSRNRFDPATRTAQLSRIFEWYEADFGGREGVIRFVNRHGPFRIDGWTIRYLEYDWALNSTD